MDVIIEGVGGTKRRYVSIKLDIGPNNRAITSGIYLLGALNIFSISLWELGARDCEQCSKDNWI